LSDHLQIEQPLFAKKPHGWIQWKGTDVCIDLWCLCGSGTHFDGLFLYYWRCGNCGRVWEMGTHVNMYEVPAERVAELEKDTLIIDPEPKE